MRLFFAVELPSRVQRALGRLRPGEEQRAYRWVDPAQMHITLAFLGEQPPALLETLQHVGERAATSSPGGILRLGPPGQFGSPRAPRVLWVGLEGDVDALHALQRNVVSELSAAQIGKRDDHSFNPHITLARRRASASPGPPAGWPPPRGSSPRDLIPMDHVTLFESRLSPHGAAYTALFAFPCGPSLTRS
jgi:2'-5' RNA ligase